MKPAEKSTPGALLEVYRPAEPVFVAGCGAELVSEDGRRYLDFTTGIAVTSLGHGAPEVTEAAREALDSGLVHASNLFRTRPGEELAQRLVEVSGLDRAFFCNSGAEAVEAALKFARRYAGRDGGPRGRGFVALKGSFHGRLFGSLSVTDRPAYRDPFAPLLPDVTFVDPRGDLAQVEARLSKALDPDRVCAVIAEPIQGEGGVRPIPVPVLQALRRITRERGLALILDEIQCGLGRTGEATAHAHADIRPDLLTLAKPLAGGLPMGAVLMDQAVADTIQPGDHGTTFGGGPLVAAVALRVVGTLTDPDFLEGVKVRARHLREALEQLAARHPGHVAEVRGRGLLLGIELHGEAAPVVARAMDAGLLLVPAGTSVIRFLPPLNVAFHELDRAVAVLGACLVENGNGTGTEA
ncbi:MAG: acetylornithine/succinylornithine family transaminase [Gemmatimonadales bacterium]|nr:MAG: acetylornithine/succinylornithine family transaminase [Gemmatimonadales bacterium]